MIRLSLAKKINRILEFSVLQTCKAGNQAPQVLKLHNLSNAIKEPKYMPLTKIERYFRLGEVLTYQTTRTTAETR